MSVIYILILVSLLVALIFLGAFLWAVRDGQYEDAVSPSVRILYEDEVKAENTTGDSTETKQQPQPSEHGT